MDIVNTAYQTLRIRRDDDICFLQLHRPESANAINDQLIAELSQVLAVCQAEAKIVVLEGLPEVFCSGADFQEIQTGFDTFDTSGRGTEQNPEPLYALWSQLAFGPFLSIAHVRGRANAGGVGFVAACDIVLCESKAVFSLSELLFGLMPACVLPFLIRRVGAAKANYMTLTTQPVAAAQALTWGLVDACEDDSENLLRKHLLRLRRLNKGAIERYKQYLRSLTGGAIESCKNKALAANQEVFSDTHNLAMIARYVRTGRFPWEVD